MMTTVGAEGAGAPFPQLGMKQGVGSTMDPSAAAAGACMKTSPGAARELGMKLPSTAMATRTTTPQRQRRDMPKRLRTLRPEIRSALQVHQLDPHAIRVGAIDELQWEAVEVE